MKNLKKISRENLKQVKGGLVKLENCVVLYGCPANTKTCYWKSAGGGGDVVCS
ncbi:hypothetical protein SAMN05421594_4435 [Chryseobacterium oleae]|uniref:Bacteriocin-type signal sequence-containing protein n=1 Tax=Chryseobacterium oleae TaxID=491207 RepID=A0A1I5CBM9_CHROL|nr:hypothetical protein [Chryseobacterium oleae]SFN84425.1 hypothetical protein SAMN05421594_4435 [Chryseobacterium oleae]